VAHEEDKIAEPWTVSYRDGPLRAYVTGSLQSLLGIRRPQDGVKSARP